MTAAPAGGPRIEVQGVSIPRLGLGTFGLEGAETAEVVSAALAHGYRHVDTAEMYGNERGVGEGIRASGVPREEIFLATKVWHENLAPGRLEAAAERSVEALGVGPVDLYYIHWPSPDVPVEAAVDALANVQDRGLAKAVAVSNFPVALIERALAASRVQLVANQVEYHPMLDQRPVLETLRANGMALTAYCPIARNRLADDPVMTRIAAAHDATVSQICLAWLLAQDGVAAIPKTSKVERLKENFAAAGIALTPQERADIDALARPGGRLINPSFGPDWDT